jgi:hypothetical protein
MCCGSWITPRGLTGRLDAMGIIKQRLPVAERHAEVECRKCGVVCQKVIHPQRCLEQSCPFLYSYEAFGRRYTGCTQGIFAVAIDHEHLERGRRRRSGFGSIRAVREPLPICPAEVERAYENREEPLGCINPEFYELPDREGFRVTENRRESG